MTASDALDGVPAAGRRPPLGGTGLALPANLALPVSGYVDVARRAEALGFDRVWAAEAGNNDAFGVLTACACATDRLGLATGVLPIYTRTPSLMAQSAATLQDVSGGRFTLGLGVSSPAVVERWNAVRWDSPLGRIKEYVEVVCELLAGARLQRNAGFYPVQGYGLLLHRVEPPPALVVGALGPRMLEAAGEVADGALLNWLGAHAVRESLARVHAGAAGAGRPGGARTAIFVRCCVTDELDAARAWARREVMGYVTVPAYRRSFEQQGWAAACAHALALWQAGERKQAAASLPQEMLDSLCLTGEGDDVRERFEAFRAAGVDEPVVFPFTGQTEPGRAMAELEATMRALAPRG